MTDEEFAKLFPGVKWPQTVERENRTQIVPPLSPSSFPPGFSNPPLTKDSVLPFSIGGINNSVPTPRDRLATFLNGIYGDAPEERDRVDNLMKYADFFGAPLFGAYDFGRALGEGRYKEAIFPGITAAAPFAGKPVKLFKEALKRRSLAGPVIKDAEELPAGSLTNSKPANELVQDAPPGSTTSGSIQCSILHTNHNAPLSLIIRQGSKTMRSTRRGTCLSTWMGIH